MKGETASEAETRLEPLDHAAMLTGGHTFQSPVLCMLGLSVCESHALSYLDSIILATKKLRANRHDEEESNPCSHES
jgi:hypothetical protein